MLNRCADIKDISKRNRINYLFRKGVLKKYVDVEGYLCYDQEEYAKIKNQKSGRKVGKNA